MIIQAVFTNESEFEKWIHEKRHQMIEALSVTFTSECIFNDTFRDLISNRFGASQLKLASIQIIFDAVKLSIEDIQAIIRFLMNQNKITKLKLGFRFCGLSIECIESAIEGISQLKHLNQLTIDFSGNPQLDKVSNINLLWSIVRKSIKIKLCHSDLQQLPRMFRNIQNQENNDNSNYSSKNVLNQSQECSNGQQQQQQITLKNCDLELIVIDLSGNPLQQVHQNKSKKTLLQEISLGIGGIVNALDRLVIKGLNASATSSTDLYEFLISTPFILDIAISKPNLLHKLIYTNFLKLINTAKRKYKQQMTLQAEKSYLNQQSKSFDSSKDFILPRKSAPKVTSTQQSLYNSQLLDYAQNQTPIQPSNPKNSAATSSLFIQLPMIEVANGADAEDFHQKQLLLSRSFEYLISQLSCILTHGKKLLTTAQFSNGNHRNGLNLHSNNGNGSNIYQIASGQYNTKLERAVSIHCVNELTLELAFSGYLSDPRELLQELSGLLLQLSTFLDIMVLRLWVKKGITDFRLASLALLTPLNPSTTFQANAYTYTKSTLMISLLHQEYISSNDIQAFTQDVIHSLPHVSVIAIAFDLKSMCCVQRISMLLNNLKQSVDTIAQVAYFYLRHQDTVLAVDEQELVNLQELVHGEYNLIHKKAIKDMPCPCIYGRFNEEEENDIEEECIDECYDDYFIGVDDDKQVEEGGKEGGEGEEDEGKGQKILQESSFFKVEDQEEEEDLTFKEKPKEKEQKSHKKKSTKKENINNNIVLEGNEENQNMDKMLQSSQIDESKKKVKTSKKKKNKLDPENQSIDIENPVISVADTQDAQEPKPPKEKPPRKKYPKKPKPLKTPEELQKQDEQLQNQQGSINQLDGAEEGNQQKTIEGRDEEQQITGEKTKGENDGISPFQPAEIQKSIKKSKPKKPKEKKVKVKVGDQQPTTTAGEDGGITQSEGQILDQTSKQEGEGNEQEVNQKNIISQTNQESSLIQEERSDEQQQQQSDKLDQDQAPSSEIQTTSKPKKKRTYVFKSKSKKEAKIESPPPEQIQQQQQQSVPQMNPLLNFAQLMIELGTQQNQGSEFDLKKWIAEELESLQKKEDSQDNGQLAPGSCDETNQGNNPSQEACQQEYKNTIGLIIQQIQQIQTEHKKNLFLSDQDNADNKDSGQVKSLDGNGDNSEQTGGQNESGNVVETTFEPTNNNISFTNSTTKLSFQQEQDIRNEFAMFIQQTQNNRINSSLSGINYNTLLNSDAYEVTAPEVPEISEIPPKKKRIKKEGETKQKVPRISKKLLKQQQQQQQEQQQEQQQQQDSEVEPKQKRKYNKNKNAEKRKTKGAKGNEKIVGEEIIQEDLGVDQNEQKDSMKGDDIEGKVEESQEIEGEIKEEGRQEEENSQDGEKVRDQESNELNGVNEGSKISVATQGRKTSDDQDKEKQEEDDDGQQENQMSQDIEQEGGLKQQDNKIKEKKVQSEVEEQGY